MKAPGHGGGAGRAPGRNGTEKGRNGVYRRSGPVGVPAVQRHARGSPPAYRVPRAMPGPGYAAVASRFMPSMTVFISCDWRASSVTATDDWRMASEVSAEMRLMSSME